MKKTENHGVTAKGRYWWSAIDGIVHHRIFVGLCDAPGSHEKEVGRMDKSRGELGEDIPASRGFPAGRAILISMTARLDN